MRIALFGLTGFGNAVYRALTRHGATPWLVVTREEPGPFPYYEEVPLSDEVTAKGGRWLPDRQGEEACRDGLPDLLLVATYHRILPPGLFESIAWRVNLHPSLLPDYAGPNPFYWMIRDGLARTGVTAHQITDRVDHGPVFAQRSLELLPHENQGTLRKRLAHLAGEVAIELVDAISMGSVTVRPMQPLQRPLPRPGANERVLDLGQSGASVLRQFRALMPYPGALALRPDGKLVDVDDVLIVGPDGLHAPRSDSTSWIAAAVDGDGCLISGRQAAAECQATEV